MHVGYGVCCVSGETMEVFGGGAGDVCVSKGVPVSAL